MDLNGLEITEVFVVLQCILHCIAFVQLSCHELNLSSCCFTRDRVVGAAAVGVTVALVVIVVIF